MFDKPFRSRAVVQRHLSSPLLQGNESESHRTLRAQTNKSSEALVRRQWTPDLLTESLTFDQLCGVHARESVPATVLSGRTPHNGDRHKMVRFAANAELCITTRVFGSHAVLDDCGS